MPRPMMIRVMEEVYMRVSGRADFMPKRDYTIDRDVMDPHTKCWFPLDPPSTTPRYVLHLTTGILHILPTKAVHRATCISPPSSNAKLTSSSARA